MPLPGFLRPDDYRLRAAAALSSPECRRNIYKTGTDLSPPEVPRGLVFRDLTALLSSSFFLNIYLCTGHPPGVNQFHTDPSTTYHPAGAFGSLVHFFRLIISVFGSGITRFLEREYVVPLPVFVSFFSRYSASVSKASSSSTIFVDVARPYAHILEMVRSRSSGSEMSSMIM